MILLIKMICEHCNNSFKHKRNLLKHQKNAVYCLKIQNNNNKKYICQGCNKDCFEQIKIDEHKETCILFIKYELKLAEDNVVYFQNELHTIKEILKEKDKLLVEKDKTIYILEESVKKPCVVKTTNNTTINNRIMNMTSLNLNNIQDIIDNKYSLDDISEGQKGIAKFAVNNFLKDSEGNLNYICTDPSRKIFKYRNDSGEVEKDINAQKLTNILTDNGITKKTTKMAQEFWTNDDGSIDDEKLSNMISKASEINFMKEDNTIFKNQLASITSL